MPTMPNYLDLDRQFMPFQDKPDWELTYNSFYSDMLFGGESWLDLLGRRRVVILAEAGAGKTAELRERARILQEDGKLAFYLTINTLAKKPLKEAMRFAADEELFTKWLASEDDAFFLIDSIDEARLDGQSLEDALSHIEKGLGDHARRATIFISCRVSDWRAIEDRALIGDYLCKLTDPPNIEPEPTSSDDEALLERVLRNRADSESGASNVKKNGNTIDLSLHIVALAPLSIKQARKLSEWKGVTDADAFITAIREADAESLANRPQDLLGLIQIWKDKNTVGTKYEILKWSITQRLREPNLKYSPQDTVSEDRALSGARAVAAAMTLGQKRFIAWPLETPSGPQDEFSLNPKEALPGWSGREQQFLLNRAIFDPASHGRVRFHHRSVQELLTAEWLLELITAGCPLRRVWLILAQEKYGATRLRPSLRPVTAWLAQLSTRIRRMVVSIAPELLIEDGDPELLSVHVRADLLHKFAALYEGRNEGGVRINLDQVERLSHPDLTDTIRTLWQKSKDSGETRELLLRLIWAGKIESCGDIALSAATGRGRVYHLALGARGVEAAGALQHKQALADHLVRFARTYPKDAYAPALAAVFPSALTLTQLEAFIRRTPADNMKSIHAGLSYGLTEISKLPDLPNANMLAALLYRILREKPYVEKKWKEHSIRYSALRAPLAYLCSRLVRNSGVSSLKPNIIAATRFVCIVSEYSNDFQTGEARKELAEAIKENVAINRQVFWLAVEAQRAEKGDLWAHHAAHGIGEPWWLREKDFDWLLRDLEHKVHPNDRLVALHAVVDIWSATGKNPERVTSIESAIVGDVTLRNALQKLLNPPPLAESEYEVHHRKIREENARERAKQDGQIREGWIQFRDRIVRDPSKLLDMADVNDLHTLAKWISCSPEHDSYAHTDWRSLGSPFSPEVAKSAKGGFVAYGRSHDPGVMLARKIQTPKVVRIALPGLAIDAKETKDWPDCLTQSEAERASRWALYELNGFPEWTPKLWLARPNAAESVIKPEIECAFRMKPTTSGVHRVVSKLSNTKEPLRSLCASWVVDVLERKEPHDASVLRHALTTVVDANIDVQDRLGIIAAKRFKSSRLTERKLVWMAVWLATEADAAIDELEIWIKSRKSNAGPDRLVLRLLNTMFEHHQYRYGLRYRDFTRFDPLVRLVRIAYAYVRQNEDNVHEGHYSADARDDAESARGQLLGMLIDTPGEHVYRELLQMITEPVFANFSEWLSVLAERHATAAADHIPWEPTRVVEFSTQQELEPTTVGDLHDVISGRLWDVEDDCVAGCFIDKSTYRQDHKGRADERPVQMMVANELDKRSNGVYSLEREAELPTYDEPDISVRCPKISHSVPIEIKVADSWSYGELVEAISVQLIGKYMRSKEATHGHLVITFHGKKSFWHKGKGLPRITEFSTLVNNLQSEADAITAIHATAEKVTVTGIDLT